MWKLQLHKKRQKLKQKKNILNESITWISNKTIDFKNWNAWKMTKHKNKGMPAAFGGMPSKNFFILKNDKWCHNLESRIIKMECTFNHIHNMFKKYIIYSKLEWNQTNTDKHA